MAILITTEGGDVITTESGIPLAADQRTSNSDIQGFDFSVNLMRSLLWEYNKATSLQSLIQKKQDWYDENQRDFWVNWISNVFNLSTANEFGLAVWAKILDLPLFINEGATPTDVSSFGFAPYGSNFNNSNFGVRGGATNRLPLETKRLALQLRYFQLCSSGTVPEINRFMKWVFRNYGQVYLTDNLDMTQTFIFLFPITWDLEYLFNSFDILPRPAGVQNIWRDGTQGVWGFSPNLNFNNGNFGNG